MFKDFKAFINRGNVLDLAVAVIIGAAFGKIVTSLTDDIIMPVIGKIFGDVDFSNYFIRLGADEAAQPVGSHCLLLAGLPVEQHEAGEVVVLAERVDHFGTGSAGAVVVLLDLLDQVVGHRRLQRRPTHEQRHRFR